MDMARDVKLRLWPGIVGAALIVIGLSLGLALPMAMEDPRWLGLLTSIVGALAVLIWWLFFSRARWSARLGVMAVLLVAWFAVRPLLDKSILNGAMGALPVFAFPVFAVALVVLAASTRNLSRRIRLVSIVPAMLIAAGLCTLVRTAGVHHGFDFHWRWTPTPEERLLALANDEPSPIPPTPP